MTESYALFPDITESSPADKPPQTPPDMPQSHLMRLPKVSQ